MNVPGPAAHDYLDLELQAPPMPGHAGLVPTLHAIRHRFAQIREPGLRLPTEFWVNMLDQQVREARQHMLDGNLDKCLNEFADCFSVAWQAIAEHGKAPEAFIVERLERAVLARAQELHDRDVVAGRTGYKPGVKP